MVWWTGWWTPRAPQEPAAEDGVTFVDEHVLLIRRPVRRVTV